MTTNHRVLKTIVYKVGSTLITITIVYAVFGKLAMATGIGLLDFVFTTLWYYYLDKFWDRDMTEKEARERANKAVDAFLAGRLKRRGFKDGI